MPALTAGGANTFIRACRRSLVLFALASRGLLSFFSLQWPTVLYVHIGAEVAIASACLSPFPYEDPGGNSRLVRCT